MTVLGFRGLLCDQHGRSPFNNKCKDDGRVWGGPSGGHASRLLLEHVDGVLILHLQLGRSVSFIDWLPIKPESNLSH